MTTPVFTCGAECAALAHWTVAAVGSVVRDTVVKRNGAASIKATGATNNYLQTSYTAGATQVGHLYIRFDGSFVAGPTQFMACDGPTAEAKIVISDTGQISLNITGGTPANLGSPLTLATWYRLDYKWSVATTTYSLKARLDLGTEAEATRAASTAGTSGYVIVGNYTSPSSSLSAYFDDLVISTTSGDYPIPDGVITGTAPEVWTDGPSWVSPADGAAIGSTPVFVFTTTASATPLHFNLQLDTSNAFNTGNLRDLDTHTAQVDWEYWNGSAWTALPATGMPAASTGNNARYTVSAALSGSTWYRRVRSGT